MLRYFSPIVFLVNSLLFQQIAAFVTVVDHDYFLFSWVFYEMVSFSLVRNAYNGYFMCLLFTCVTRMISSCEGNKFGDGSSSEFFSSSSLCLLFGREDQTHLNYDSKKWVLFCNKESLINH